MLKYVLQLFCKANIRKNAEIAESSDKMLIPKE